MTHGMYLEDLSLGQSADLTRAFSDADVRAFAALTGDDNPIHLDEAFAAAGPFRRRIVHGALVTSLLSAVMGVKLPGPGAVYISQTVDYRRPVRLDDPVTAIVEVAEITPETNRVRLACSCKAAGKTVLTGEAVLRVANRPSAAG